MLTKAAYLWAHLLAAIVLGGLSLWAQSIEPTNPKLAMSLMATGIPLGFTIMGFAGFYLIRVKSTGRIVAAAAAAVLVPACVEMALQISGTPVNTDGSTVLAVLFYWIISAVLALLLGAGLFYNLAIERQNSTTSPPGSR